MIVNDLWNRRQSWGTGRRPNRKRKTATLGALLAAVALLAACESSQAPAEGDTSPQGDTPATSLDMGLLRSDLYELSRLLTTAQSIEANACMIDAGFEALPIALPPPRSASAPEAGALAGYRLAPGEAATSGYDAAPRSAPRPADPRDQIRLSLDPAIFDDAWTKAYYGDPAAVSSEDAVAGVVQPSGCYGAASDRVVDGVSSELIGHIRQAENLWGDAYEHAELDAGYSAARENWSSCMTSRGFQGFSELHDAYEAGQELKAQGERAREIDQAIADAACQQDSAILAAYADAWNQAQVQLAQTVEAADLLRWHQANYKGLTEAVIELLADAGYERN